MADRKEYIERLERDANQLLAEIISLRAEVGSYRKAVKELDKVREALSKFLNKTGELTEQTYKLLKIMNEIGSAKIFQQLETIAATMDISSKKLTVIIVLVIAGIITVTALQVYIVFSKTL